MGETRPRSSSVTRWASTTSAAHRIAYPLRDWPPPRRQWKPRSATAKPCSFLETPKDNISLPRLRGRVGWGSFPTKVPTVLRVRLEETRLPRRTTEVAICRRICARDTELLLFGKESDYAFQGHAARWKM